MKRLVTPLLGLALLICTPSFVDATWTLGNPVSDANLHKTVDIVSSGMTDQPNTAFKVYLKIGFNKYDIEDGMSLPAGNPMWTKTLVAPHDCPVSDDPAFVLEVAGNAVGIHSVDMEP